MIAESSFLSLAASLAQLVMTAALVLGLVRLARGPSLADRVVALDLVAVVAAGLIALEAVREGQPLLLRPAFVVALLGFLGTVAFAHSLLRRKEES